MKQQDNYRRYLEHHGTCENCQEALTKPPEVPSQLIHVLPDLSTCPEGLGLARACVSVDLEPGLFTVLPFDEQRVSPQTLSPAIAIGPGQTLEIFTRPLHWATIRVAGFRARIYRPPETNPMEAEARRLLGVEDMVMVGDLKIGGSINLFFHEDFIDLRAFEAKREFARLRNDPILRPPNQAYVTLHRPNLVPDAAPIHVCCELIVEPLVDEITGHGMASQAYLKGSLRRRIIAATDALLEGIGKATEELEAIAPSEASDPLTDPNSPF